MREMSPRERLTRIAAALARVDVAIQMLVDAHRDAREALPPTHGAIDALLEADTQAKVARGKLELAFKRIP